MKPKTKDANDVITIISNGELNFNLDIIKNDIKSYWGKKNEILFPITFNQIRRADPSQLGFSVSDIGDSGKVYGNWVFNNNYNQNHEVFILPKSILDVWLHVNRAFPSRGIAARLAKDENNSFYVYFHLMKVNLGTGGTGGDNIKVGIKVP